MAGLDIGLPSWPHDWLTAHIDWCLRMLRRQRATGAITSKKQYCSEQAKQQLCTSSTLFCYFPSLPTNQTSSSFLSTHEQKGDNFYRIYLSSEVILFLQLQLNFPAINKNDEKFERIRSQFFSDMTRLKPVLKIPFVTVMVNFMWEARVNLLE